MIQVDAASATIVVDPGVSKAKPAVQIAAFNGRNVAVAHLTEGISLANAVASGSPIVEPVIKMVGKLDVLFDPGDDATLPGFNFGFIQIGSVLVLEDLYVGRTINEGHVKLKHRLKVSPTVLLDSTAAFKPFSSRAGTIATETRGPKKVSHLTIDLGISPGKKGDSPHGLSGAVITNRDTNAENFLFEFRADVGFTTVLVAIDPQQKIQPLAHVNWHVVWHTQFKWKGAANPVATPVAINNQIGFGQVIKGAPLDSAVAALVTKPAGPFFNEITDGAKKASVTGQRPNREDNFSRPSGIPVDFFS